jgi:hypothetical protein
MKLKLKRDEESIAHPHVDQLEVGELVMNSVPVDCILNLLMVH